MTDYYEHIARKLGNAPVATDIEKLKYDTFFGREKENLVFPIALANLVLHGIDQPNLWHGNALTRRATYSALFQYAPTQFDVILTNPPFGGKEGKDAQKNFAFETSATQVLFVQDILSELAPNGTCAIVLDEGLLFRTNESAFVETKRKLLDECDLWTIVSLPGGVFSTAGAGVKTNLLFFTKGKKTGRIWYYDLSWVKVGKKTPLTLAHFGFGKDGAVLNDDALPAALLAEWQADEANAGQAFPSYARLLASRGDSRYSWTVDFAARRAKAREEMQPLLDKAASIKATVIHLKEDLKRQKKDKADEKKIKALEAAIREQEKSARDLETEAAAIDATVFDLKAVNPNAVETLRCWGENGNGQVGIGLPAMPPQAKPPHPAETFVEGTQHCERYAWRDTTCTVEYPEEVIASGVESVVAKDNATCAIVRGTLYCWGRNNPDGSLGIATGNKDLPKPVRVIERGVSFAAIGPKRTCAIVDGALQCSHPCDQAWCTQAGFDAKDLAFGLSPFEVRLGVWRGTIGESAIMACLQRNYDSQYYYIRHGPSIALTAEANTDGAIWTERNGDSVISATWRLDSVNGDMLAGQWSDLTGQRKLPIRLKRVKASGNQDGEWCDMRAFNTPRIDAQMVKSKSGPWNKRKQELSVLDGTVTAIVLLEDTPNVKSFNDGTRQWLRGEIADYYDCLMMSDGRMSFSSNLEIEWRADPWIVAREHHDLYCGGAHPSAYTTHQIWNLAEGKHVTNPWTWVSTFGKRDDCPYMTCEHQPTDALNDLIVDIATRNEDGDGCTYTHQGNCTRKRRKPCPKSHSQTSSYDMGLVTQGT